MSTPSSSRRFARISFIALSLLALFPGAAQAIFNPVRSYEGDTFFDRWDFYGNVDNTTWGGWVTKLSLTIWWTVGRVVLDARSGAVWLSRYDSCVLEPESERQLQLQTRPVPKGCNVTYQDRNNATSKKLAFINGAGNAIVKVDNSSVLSPPLAMGDVVNRDSIRLTSLDSYPIGSLIIIDVLHVPFGCSVWPSFWTYGIQEEWPSAGEIDIIEAINQMDHNQIALHTRGGCSQSPPPMGVQAQTGNTIEGDCSTDRGCIVAETKPNSYGAGLNAAGGGVYAVQMALSGIYVWFWSRPDIPQNILQSTATSTMDVTSWGIPTASYPNTTCDMETFFPPQNLVLLTTLCGVWAGVPDIYQSTCKTPTGSCFNDNVLGPASNFDQAYWEIRYIRTFLADDAPPIPPQWATTSSSSPSSTAGSTSPTEGAGSGGSVTGGTGVRPPVANSNSKALRAGGGSLGFGGVGALMMFLLGAMMMLG
ncbi:hypothetical protein D9613_004737 [Agrocybe pediades]|uniref:GH16 domain-containing protein n=1 Tax=Agrocybe pediades TaxID=84607 RepID=A0A8H4QX67_9AGAR|nr:hypothetical protein D9613_004737 [Agrocybe pediades]